MLYEILINNRR